MFYIQDDMTSLMDEVDDNIKVLQKLQSQLRLMDTACDDARELVIQTALHLKSRISEHERRLLNDIEVFRDTQYKKCGSTRGQYDSFMHDLEQDREKIEMELNARNETGGEICDDGGKGLSKDVDELEKRLTENNINTKANIDRIVFNPVRCNTAFGTIDLLEELPRSPKQGKQMMRSASVGNQIVGMLHVKNPDVCRPRSSFMAQDKPLLNVHKPMEVKAKGRMERRISVQPAGQPDLVCDQGQSSSGAEEVVSRKCVWKVTKEGSDLGEVNCPNDVVFLHDNSVVVSDRDNCRLQIFDSQGKGQRSLLSGTIKPRRLALTREGHVALTDSMQSNVKVVSMGGQLVKTWANRKKQKPDFVCPCGIAMSSKANFIISDLEKHTLTMFNRDGKSPKPLQSSSSCFEFHSPSYIAIDGNDRILISDSWYQILYVFEKTGKLAFEVSKTSEEHGGHLKYPNGLCVDERNNIYVADWGNHTVTKFSSDGTFMEHVLTREDGILHPAGVTVHKGRLAVTEYSDSHSAVGVYTMSS